MDGYLNMGESDNAADHLVEGAVAATGVEAHRLVGMVGAPLAGPQGGVAGSTGDVYLVIEIWVGGGISLNLLGH